MCHCAGGRGLGIDTATPDDAVYEYADYADYADTNTPITPTTLIKLIKLIKLITDRRRARVCWAIVRCSATGLVLLCVLLCISCIAFHLRTVITLRLLLVLYSPQILRL